MKPWEKRPEETTIAFERFSVYLHLGPNRSLAKAVKEMGRAKHYVQRMKVWSKQHDWVARCEAYDVSELEAGMETRTTKREHARNLVVSHQAAAVKALIRLLEHEDTPPSVRLGAARDLLDRAGLVAPRRYELSAAKGTGISVQLKQDADQFTSEELAKICELIGEPDDD